MPEPWGKTSDSSRWGGWRVELKTQGRVKLLLCARCKCECVVAFSSQWGLIALLPVLTKQESGCLKWPSHHRLAFSSPPRCTVPGTSTLFSYHGRLRSTRPAPPVSVMPLPSLFIFLFKAHFVSLVFFPQTWDRDCSYLLFNFWFTVRIFTNFISKKKYRFSLFSLSFLLSFFL